MSDKPIYWIGSSRQDIRKFSDEARRKAGFQLRALQRGQMPTDFKPMPTIGQGVEEIRIRTEGAYRIFYVAGFEEAVYVLHGFEKKTQKTSQKDLKIGEQRYQQVIELRRSQKEQEIND
ncbi:MAG: type II toxin-antitoxin system RelE/ParE family toxin [Moorea sp. SIO4E2]|uniref:type II toxin-antitoxin system RelE/ParE family toxin n=1 Tax=Moorena sp. SIO4E2 TaxID=2607826 RepID=UPI0013B7E891|nr:type II toxin-antitoxin system RelE/ParE family toxin [Moorena sp. SIO4E2]NEQ12270.1 type II toxin-antitoxin system RelE/ParE family toxin [Moorena sp. SIO4E2]